MAHPDPPRPLAGLPVAGGGHVHGSAPAPRHETVLPPEPPDAVAALEEALTTGEGSRPALSGVAGTYPSLLDAWARLSEQALSTGDAVAAYAFARVAYHRGLDRLRRAGWGGVGMVRWAHETNRPFLRGLRALLAAAAMLEELDEAERCRSFLLDLDPDDALGAAAYPAVPDRTWTPPALPD